MLSGIDLQPVIFLGTAFMQLAILFKIVMAVNVEYVIFFMEKKNIFSRKKIIFFENNDKKKNCEKKHDISFKDPPDLLEECLAMLSSIDLEPVIFGVCIYAVEHII